MRRKKKEKILCGITSNKDDFIRSLTTNELKSHSKHLKTLYLKLGLQLLKLRLVRFFIDLFKVIEECSLKGIINNVKRPRRGQANPTSKIQKSDFRFYLQHFISIIISRKKFNSLVFHKPNLSDH